MEAFFLSVDIVSGGPRELFAYRRYFRSRLMKVKEMVASRSQIELATVFVWAIQKAVSLL